MRHHCGPALKAGRLLTPSYENVEQAWAKACGEHSRLVCALQWLYNDPAISTVQFEFAGPEQAQEYIDAALECRPEALDSFDLLWDNKVREAYYANRMFKCTTCRCCMPCPAGVDAPRIIELYHESMMSRKTRSPSCTISWRDTAGRPVSSVAPVKRTVPSTTPLWNCWRGQPSAFHEGAGQCSGLTGKAGGKDRMQT